MQTKADKSQSQQNISNQVCSICWFLHYFAKTSKQQGIVVIKETTLQQEDAWQAPRCQASASCHVFLNTCPLMGGLFWKWGGFALPQTRNEE